MSKRKRINLDYDKHRVILSDVLPYEVPIIFSNRYFYQFLSKYKINFNSEGNIEWIDKGNESVGDLLKLILGIELNNAISQNNVSSKIKFIDKRNSVKRKNRSKGYIESSIPFSYKISHKETEFRELAICHPANQLYVIDFYDKNKDLILYYSKESEYSIRKPSKVGTYTLMKKEKSKAIVSADDGIIDCINEESEEVNDRHALSNNTELQRPIGNKYDNLKSFFVYSDYSNVYKFYESRRYHRCEKKYNKLLKLDISKCFDSIYTHSISWAIFGKEVTKENVNSEIDGNRSAIRKSFPGTFDSLMQRLNYNETNGIIIGPEFSRIFAELILQSIDKELCNELKKDDYRLEHKTDYELLRYVDDYFLFYNDEKDKDKIVELLQLKLKTYKLSLNNSKTEILDKPLITNISIAKNKISQLFNDDIGYEIETIPSDVTEETKEESTKKGTIKVRSNQLIVKFKTIIKECNVQYKDLLNYSFFILEKKCKKILEDYCTIEKVSTSEKDLIKAIWALIDFAFFIYSVSPRVNTTIKLNRMLILFIDFLKNNSINVDFKNHIFNFIYENIMLILNKKINKKHIQIETLELLIVMAELGRDYRLSKGKVCELFDINLTAHPSENKSLNYFSLMSLLFYIKNIERYKQIRERIEELIKYKFEERKNTLNEDTELTLLLLDTLSCPYIDSKIKVFILDKYYNCSDSNKQMAIIKARPFWFIKWTNFKLKKELDTKQSDPVY